MTLTIANPLPAEGRTIGILGKGGSGKSTTLAHLIAHWSAMGIPVTGHDADEPGEDEPGSLLDWSDILDEVLGIDKPGLGAPVYRTPKPSGIAGEIRRLRPAHGLAAIDTGSWDRRPGNAHYAVLACADLVIVSLKPTNMEKNRGGSILAAVDQVEAMSGKRPNIRFLLNMVNVSARSRKDVRNELTDEGFIVLESEIPNSDSQDGYAQAFGRIPQVAKDSPMHQLALEVLREVCL